MCFSPINRPSQTSQIHPNPLPASECLSFFPIKAILCCPNIPGHVTFCWSMVDQVLHSWRKLTLSQQLKWSIAPWAGVCVCGVHVQVSSPRWALVWLVYDVKSTGSPYVQLPCSILKIPLSSKHSWPLALTLSLLPLLQWFLSLGGGVQCMFHLGLRILEPFTWPVGDLVNQHLLQHWSL